MVSARRAFLVLTTTAAAVGVAAAAVEQEQRFTAEETTAFAASREGLHLVLSFGCLSLFYMWPYQTIVQTQNFINTAFPEKTNVGLIIMICCTWPLLFTHSFLSLTGVARWLPYTCKVIIPMIINVIGAGWMAIVMLTMSDKADALIYSLYSTALVLSVAESFIEPAVYDMAGLMPSTLTSMAVQSGNGACGLVVSLIQMATRLITSGAGTISADQAKGLTLFFFGLMACTSLSNIAIYCGIVRRSNAYQNYVKFEGSARLRLGDGLEPLSGDQLALEVGDPSGGEARHGSMLRATLEAARHVWPSTLCIVLTFFVTLTLWPAIPGRSCAGEKGGSLQSWWFDLILFAFNLGDFLGKIEKRSLSWGAEHLSPRWQLILSVLRAALFLPLIVFSGAPQSYDYTIARWVNFIGVLALGISNGWLSTVCFMRAPKALPPGTPNAVAEQASGVLVIGLFLGISSGTLAAYILGEYVITDKLGVCFGQ